jgi:type VI secretion system secreted protein VgrG
LEEVAVDFEVHGTDADEGWYVAHATLTEAVSDLSTATLLLSHRDLGADPHALLGRTCTVTLRRGEQRLHAMSGLLGSVVNGGPSPRRRLARVIVTSSLGALSLRRDYRCFQDLDAVAVIKEVLREANVYQRKGALEVHVDRRHLPRREYCVQYGETDLEFVRRLLEEEGLFFYFKALDGDGDGEAREVLVIDDPQRRRRRSDHVPSPAGAVYVVDRHERNRTCEGVLRAELARALAPTCVAVEGFNFTHPAAATGAVARAVLRGAHEAPHREHTVGITFSDWSGDGDESPTHRAHDADRRARTMLDGLRSGAKVTHGEGDVAGFSAGRTFVLRGHDHPKADGEYLLVRVEHTVDVPEALGDDAVPDERRTPYRNRFACVRTKASWLPQRATRRPVVLGPQTATVMAEPGSKEDICIDAHGRILVRFHWDHPDRRTPSERPKRASCRVRVAQSWAGAGWGTLFIPRVGMEVVVHFLDGDPDRPLVTGCVYNGRNRPPHDLRKVKTRSTIRTNSTPGDGGHNELTFDDDSGHEQVLLRAERDLEVTVRHDARETVGHDRALHVRGDQRVIVKGGERKDVQGGDGARLHVRHHYLVIGDEGITLRCGASTIVMTPGGIAISAPTVNVSGSASANVSGGPALNLTGGQIKLNS